MNAKKRHTSNDDGDGDGDVTTVDTPVKRQKLNAIDPVDFKTSKLEYLRRLKPMLFDATNQALLPVLNVIVASYLDLPEEWLDAERSLITSTSPFQLDADVRRATLATTRWFIGLHFPSTVISQQSLLTTVARVWTWPSLAPVASMVSPWHRVPVRIVGLKSNSVTIVPVKEYSFSVIIPVLPVERIPGVFSEDFQRTQTWLPSQPVTLLLECGPAENDFEERYVHDEDARLVPGTKRNSALFTVDWGHDDDALWGKVKNTSGCPAIRGFVDTHLPRHMRKNLNLRINDPSLIDGNDNDAALRGHRGRKHPRRLVSRIQILHPDDGDDE
jgi:hypothetical protein